jgi:hypothetical protein
VGKRGDKRGKKKRRGRKMSMPPNPHVEVIVESLASTGALLREITRAADPIAAVDDRISSVVKELTGALVGIEPAGTIEVIRMMLLPWSPGTATGYAGAEDGASIAEVLALAFLVTGPRFSVHRE